MISTVTLGLHPRMYVFLAILLVCAAGLAGCTQADRSLVVVQSAIDTLDRRPGTWQTAMQGTNDELGKVGNTTGAEARCIADFVDTRVKQQLQRSLHSFDSERSDPVYVPVACTTNPPDKDGTGSTQLVAYYGYDRRGLASAAMPVQSMSHAATTGARVVTGDVEAAASMPVLRMSRTPAGDVLTVGSPLMIPASLSHRFQSNDWETIETIWLTPLNAPQRQLCVMPIVPLRLKIAFFTSGESNNGCIQYGGGSAFAVHRVQAKGLVGQLITFDVGAPYPPQYTQPTDHLPK